MTHLLYDRYWLKDSSGYRLRSHGVAAVADNFVHRGLGANRVLCQMADADESSGEEWQESGSETEAVFDDPTQPASKKPEELKPLGKLKKGFVWKPVDCTDALIHIRGGFSAEYLTAPSVSYTTGQVTHRFVQLSKNATWFLKGVGGKSTFAGALPPNPFQEPSGLFRPLHKSMCYLSRWVRNAWLRKVFCPASFPYME